jgi:cation:H+ antiporter
VAFVWFLAGLVALIVGAEALVRGASRLAAAFGIPPLVIGLTVVAFGTSAPELAVSVAAARAGSANLALGNVVGSNIMNVLFILGVSAVIVPLTVSRQLVRVDVPLMIGLSVAVLLLALDGRLSRLEGLLLVLGLAAYVTFLIVHGRQETAPAASSPGPLRRAWVREIILIVAGLALLVLGSRWLVAGAVAFAEWLGVSDLIIGLTIVAAGTSLPEVVTSIVAAARGERDIAVGNVVGSNIFNLMGVLGFASLAAPGGIDVSPAILWFDLPVMIAVAAACLPVFFTGGTISRGEGALFLAYYGAYTAYLILGASRHASAEAFGTAMLYFIIPLTAVTLLVIAGGELRRGRQW